MQKSSVKNISTVISDNKYRYTGRQDKTPRPPLLIETNRAAACQKASGKTTLSEKILASITEAYVLTDDKGLIRDTNKKLLDLLGYSAAELRGIPLDLILRESSNFDGTGAGGVASPEGRSDPGAALKTRSKVLIPVDLSIVPYTDEATGSCFTIILAKDLREENRLYQELEMTKKYLSESALNLAEFKEGVLYMLKNLDHSEKELQATNLELRETQAQLVQTTKLKALGELTAGLAHELNQPLTVIRGISQHLIRDLEEDSPQIERLKFINSATKKMEKTISHLKAFSRLDDEVMLLISEILKSKNIKVKLDLGKVPLVKGRPNRLEQVIINIITNARDAMPGGGTIEVTSSAIEIYGIPCATVTFRDTGCGIPENIKKRLFEPFFTTKDVNEGTGLGLSISYGIIKDHRGDIWFESTTEGTTFHISIPASSNKNT